jgi:hypothetical protein
MDMPVFPEDTVPKPLLGKSVSFGWMPWVHGICYDEQGQLLVFYISITTDSAEYKLTFRGVAYAGNFDIANHSYADGVLAIGTNPKIIIDYRLPHSVSIVAGSMNINFSATYRGAPLWYSKTLDANDMLPVRPPTVKVGGYDAPIKIIGKINGSQLLSFSGYGDWEHTWFTGGSYTPPHQSLWMIFNCEEYYCVIIEDKADDGAVLFHIGRFAEVGKAAYVFDDYQWSDDGNAAPLSVEIRGQVENPTDLAKGTVDLKTDPEDVFVFSPHAVIYKNVTLVGSSSVGTAWAEIRRSS